MKCGHLFNGIGGFALAAHWMGWENIMHCEIDPFCNRVMNKHFPNSHQHEDIRTTDFTIWRGKIDLITGGFPCQPYSTAGKRKGTADDRHLWPEMLRAIREISPRWIVGENVRGLTNWNGGMVFDQVQADMEAAGYEVIPFLLPAAGVGAPHKRHRIWLIAYVGSFNCDLPIQQRRQDTAKNVNANGKNESRFTTDTHGSQRPERRLYKAGQQTTERYACTCDACGNERAGWENFPTQPPVRSGNDGIPGGLVDITISKWAEGCLTALGNAIVPQVALEIFKAIEEYETLRANKGFRFPGMED